MYSGTNNICCSSGFNVLFKVRETTQKKGKQKRVKEKVTTISLRTNIFLMVTNFLFKSCRLVVDTITAKRAHQVVHFSYLNASKYSTYKDGTSQPY